jgi:beta-lactamase superfamily II metal-dependent hydrolase
MRIRLYHAGDGDCLLLTEADSKGVERHILVDGGRKAQFRDHARADIYSFPRLDLVYVSHIDDDHISAVVALTEDMVAWRVHDRRVANGESSRAPQFPRPPEVREIWHNSLFELVGSDLEPQVEGALTATAGILAGSADSAFRDVASRMGNLAAGEKSSLELSRRISSRQLGIKRNRPRNKVMEVGARRRVGPFTIRILGPTHQALVDLRAGWESWIRTSKKALRDLQKEMLDDERDLGALSSVQVARPDLATALGEGSITEPNLASLMLLVSRGDAEILLTGDGSSEDVLAGLDRYRKRNVQGRCHVSALKVQHHGAAANVSEEFVRSVTADHYIFCGNGAHRNPEQEVVERLARARLGPNAAGPNESFTFWFSTDGDTPGLSLGRARHMKSIEKTVTDIARDEDPDNRFKFQFYDGTPLDIVI